MVQLSGPDVVVVGSANIDLVLGVPAIPNRGETVLATTVARGAGGKGVNQAVAAARSGASTALLAAVGPDDAAVMLGDALRSAGVNTSHVRTTNMSTGLAVVTVGSDGENLIVVAPGANSTLTALSPRDCDLIAKTRVLLIQLEIPIDGVLATAAHAHSNGATVILNAAPARPLPARLRSAIDLLLVNEHEAAELTNRSVDQPEQLLNALLDQVPEAIITLGPKGSRYASRTGDRISIEAPRVHAIDTTAAGDTYCGVLAAALAAGHATPEAMIRASAAAALTVQRRGAVAAIPAAAEIAAVQATMAEVIR